MQSPDRIAGPPADWRGRGWVRLLFLIAAAVAIAAVASILGIARDYIYLRASLLTGNPGGRYHAVGTSLATRASRGHGRLIVVPTAGSVENVGRLAEKQGRCAAMFALPSVGSS